MVKREFEKTQSWWKSWPQIFKNKIQQKIVIVSRGLSHTETILWQFLPHLVW